MVFTGIFPIDTDDFENLRQRAEFNLVASRKAQAITLAAEKAGEKTVDMESIMSETRKKALEAAGSEDNGNDEP